MTTKYKLEAEINPETGLYRVKPITFDKWQDFGFWLEVAAYMASIAKGNRTNEEIAEYIRNYILKALNTGMKEINDPSIKGIS